jgi:glucokinase
MSELILALDVGGTKIAAGLVDRRGTLVHSAKQPTPDADPSQPGGQGVSPEAIWQVVDDLITDAVTAARGMVRGVGIASAGPIDTTDGTVSPINIWPWRDRFPLRERIAAAVPNVPVRLAGDAVCVALGEHWRGAGTGSRFLLGMVVSTGVGGGLVLDGAPYHGRAGNAGHVGHVVVEPDGPPCACGGRGCVESIASGPRMAQWARENGWSAPPTAGAAELAEAANAGDPVALRAFQRGGAAVGRMIASVAAVCDLELAVIGGGVAKSGPLLFDAVREAVATHARLDYLRGLRVVPAELGGDAGLVGAAALIAGPGADTANGRHGRRD